MTRGRRLGHGRPAACSTYSDSGAALFGGFPDRPTRTRAGGKGRQAFATAPALPIMFDVLVAFVVQMLPPTAGAQRHVLSAG